jgi:hypothetical protein
MTSPHSDAEAGWCFEHRALWLPRGDNSPEEWEDAYDVNPSRRLAALCDGAGSGIFSRLWANILANSVVEEQPNLTDAEALEHWLGRCRDRWAAGIDFSALRYTQQLRLRNVGAGATLLVLQLTPQAPVSDFPEGSLAWTAWAVGDSCLFWVRDNRLLATFPPLSADEFTVSTPLLQTAADRPVIRPVVTEEMGKLGDFFLLASDASAQLLIQRCEQGAEPEWERFWQVADADWRNEIVTLRQRGEIVDDDCTLLAIRIRPESCISQRSAGTSPAG